MSFRVAVLPSVRNFKAVLHFGGIWLIARSRIFDPYWYRAEYPECDAQVLGPITHYVLKTALIAFSRLTDAWRGTENRAWDEQGLRPIVHYLLEGARQGLRPHLLFDPAWYGRQHGATPQHPNPLIDYIRHGAAKGLEPSPFFSSSHYRKSVGSTQELTPLGHFIEHGLPAGATPTPLFDRAWYLENNPDVRRAGFDPFLHFVASGSRNGRSPGPLFDAAWYRMKNTDVRDQGFEPLPHYLAIGAAQGRDPSPFFNATFYAGSVLQSLVLPENALAHYAEHGREQWRSTHPILPPPASEVAFFEDFPWRRQAPDTCDAPFRVLIVDIVGKPADRSAQSVQLLAALQELPQLDLYAVTTRATAWARDGIAVLDLSGDDLASRDKGVVLERLLRALKFRDAKALVIEGDCEIAPLADLCKEIALPHHCLVAGASPGTGQWREILRDRSGYRAAPRPTVSVIVPSYNHARYLDERLGSILGQRQPPDEIIVLDDCSSDDSLAVIESWQGRSQIPFTILRNEVNSGSPFTQWAKGLSQARHDLIWIAESDDSCYPQFIERLAASFSDPDVALAYSDSEVIGTQGEMLSQTYRFYTDALDDRKWLSGYVETGLREIETALSIKNTIPNVSAVLFRRKILQNVIRSIKNYHYCGDWLAYVECLRRGKVAYCPQALNRHRREPGGVTQDGERATRAVHEALAIKTAIFRELPCEARSVWLSLAQTIFEYELRSAALMMGRPSFTENPDLRASLRELSGILPKPSEEEFKVEAYLEALASSALNLDKAERTQIVGKVILELRLLAGRTT